MFWLVIVLTFALTVYVGLRAWLKFEDPLHPAIFIAPLFAYSYAVEPFLLRDDLGFWFKNIDDLLPVVIYNLFCIAAFSIGLASQEWRSAFLMKENDQTSYVTRNQLAAIAGVLATIGFLAFCYGLYNVGGFYDAYSKAKGGGRSTSGYIGEAVNLGLIGALFIALARRGLGLTANNWILLVVGIAPNLIQGTFGGRRGPLFLSLGVMMLAVVLTSRKKVSVSKIALGVTTICVCVLFIWSQRSSLFLGNEEARIDWEKFTNLALLENVDQGNNFIYGSGHILTASRTNKFTWGGEILVNIVIRPIPKQVWPTKYEDIGADWIGGKAGFGSFSEDEWYETLEWIPFTGSSAGTASDLFGEFSWGAVLVYLLIGWGFSYLYWKHRTNSGVWTILLLQAIILSIYLATQSFSAFYHRYLILAVPTVLIWRYLVDPRSKNEFGE